MLILTLIDPQQQMPLRQWCFSQESLIRIGRSPENHVVLTEPIVSRHHVDLQRVETTPTTLPQLATPADTWRLINHSANGTFLNGYLVTQSQLPGSGRIQLAHNGPSLQFQVVNATSELPLSPPVLSPAKVSAASQPANYLKALLPPAPLCAHADNAPDNLFCIHCGQPLQIRKTIRQYQVLKELGRGGMGTTYLVWSQRGGAVDQPPVGQLLVLKEMNADMARIPKAQELFEREAVTLKSLSHPGIPCFYDFFIENGNKYLVMELVHGQDLEKWVRKTGPVAIEQAIVWMSQTCDVLDYLHNRPIPIIHRDIKPSNLIVRNLSQRIAVLDFGAVKSVGGHSGTRIGADGYSAPEQTQGRPLIQSDLYAIGPCLIYLLTGENPHRFQKRTARSTQFVLKDVAAIPPRLKQVIERATAFRSGDRYTSAKELSKALLNCI